MPQAGIEPREKQNRRRSRAGNRENAGIGPGPVAEQRSDCRQIKEISNQHDFAFAEAITGARETRSVQARNLSISWAALWPGAPMTPPPGCVPLPQRNSPWIGVRYWARLASGRSENI